MGKHSRIYGVKERREYDAADLSAEAFAKLITAHELAAEWDATMKELCNWVRFDGMPYYRTHSNNEVIPAIMFSLRKMPAMVSGVLD